MWFGVEEGGEARQGPHVGQDEAKGDSPSRMRLAGGRAPDLCVSAFQFFASLKAIDRARNFFSVGAVRLPEIGEAGGERVFD